MSSINKNKYSDKGVPKAALRVEEMWIFAFFSILVTYSICFFYFDLSLNLASWGLVDFIILLLLLPSQLLFYYCYVCLRNAFALKSYILSVLLFLLVATIGSLFLIMLLISMVIAYVGYDNFIEDVGDRVVDLVLFFCAMHWMCFVISGALMCIYKLAKYFGAKRA